MEKIKITIISKNKQGFHVNSLVSAARCKGVAINVLDFKSLNDLKIPHTIGDVIIWRASNLDIKSERFTLGALLKDKIIINQAIFKNPYITYKLYQQKIIENLKNINHIPTYRYRNLQQIIAATRKQNTIKYPFIAKPNLGSQGKGIMLIENEAGLASLSGKFDDYVFQNFIQNEGDWRVILVGGRSLGVMRRKARDKGFLNNISQGGTAELETDPRIIKKVENIATKAAAIFGYTYCGVDVIQDDNTGTFYFLEINSAPEWDGKYGFQAITGVDVGVELINLCIELAQRKKLTTADLVKSYYDKNINYLDINKKVHYASRIFLWTKDQKAKRILDQLKKDYIGNNPRNTLSKLNKDAQTSTNDKEKSIAGVVREKYYNKYPIKKYNPMLFKVLFAESLYGLNLRPIIQKLKLDTDMIRLYEQLNKDDKALKVLSTHAINFFYLLKNYFRDNVKQSEKIKINPRHYIYLANTFFNNLDKDISKILGIRLQIYLLTHAIIGKSLFYQKQVEDPRYLEMVKIIEKLIQQYYFEITLDLKFEFLVCATLCGYNSYLRPVIHSEADQSFSPQGNYLIDSYNPGEEYVNKDRFIQAEHRNVLFLMSCVDFVGEKDRKKKKLSIKRNKKLTIGRRLVISLPDSDLSDITAKIDTGARYSSIHCKNIKVIKRGKKEFLAFRILDSGHKDYETREIVTDDFEIKKIRDSSGITEKRYLVKMNIIVLGKKYQNVHFTLSDRSNMIFPVLLGRHFLINKFVVDVSRQ